jgi:hypothetical protein
MTYDLPMITELCNELGYEKVESSSDKVEVELLENVTLAFQNIDNCTDSLMGFLGTPWHNHGDIMFSGQEGQYIEMTYLDVVSGLKEGKILVCELHNNEVLKDRYLVHRDLVDEFNYMEPGDEIRVRRIA